MWSWRRCTNKLQQERCASWRSAQFERIGEITVNAKIVSSERKMNRVFDKEEESITIFSIYKLFRWIRKVFKVFHLILVRDVVNVSRIPKHLFNNRVDNKTITKELSFNLKASEVIVRCLRDETLQRRFSLLRRSSTCTASFDLGGVEDDVVWSSQQKKALEKLCSTNSSCVSTQL